LYAYVPTESLHALVPFAVFFLTLKNNYSVQDDTKALAAMY